MIDKTETQLLDKIGQLPIIDLPIDSIKADGKNPNQMTDEMFAGFVQHIKDNGIINPILVTKSGVMRE